MQPQSNSILMALIAIGLGFAASQALHSSPAQGYPLGAVSLGSNPIDMAAGTASTSPVTVFEASTEHNFVVTDVVLTLAGAGDWNSCTSQVKLLNSAGTRLGSFQLQSDQAQTYSRDPGSPRFGRQPRFLQRACVGRRRHHDTVQNRHMWIPGLHPVRIPRPAMNLRASWPPPARIHSHALGQHL